MIIKEYEAEKLKDPTGILEGDRYEFFLEIDIPEDDELFSENGVYLKVIFSVNGTETRIANYQFFEDTTNKLLDFELEEEEELLVKTYCEQHYMNVM
ncbi:DUF6509 family protein [Sutcliffiella rhizosphaerae]|uniref:Pullulanase n=1 Tax=Sutcliffiella rhizosphaerae TaxID=2880967 RepID=A0ABM8YRP5_9BACI|nr:DUF6509 family protein [Sutcliffiella rhizosphaerae]CAG9622665.1 hypothetical protein BACCIP111883_03456 [Sutcliffiella rhizosphaerae]